jgi:ribosomal protein S18 acetylase RimI-like enzyme
VDELPEPAGSAVRRYLRWADAALPGRVVGCYVVGSIALGAYRPERSDVDLVVVVDGDLSTADLRRVRALQWRSGAATAPAALRRGDLSLPGTVNATWVRAADLARPVTAIVPVCHHTGPQFHVGQGFDVNPVQWKTLADHGVAVRGADVATLALDPEPAALEAWNRANLEGYWRRWAEALDRAGPSARYWRRERWVTAWGILGAPRLHVTITTGEVVSKEAAGEHALATFDERWHPVVREGLAYWRGEPVADPRFADREVRWHETAGFVLEVCRSVA